MFESWFIDSDSDSFSQFFVSKTMKQNAQFVMILYMRGNN